MRQGMDVLIVTPFLAFPLAHGGRVRTYRLAVELARLGATVDVLCPWRPGFPARSFQSDGITVHTHLFVSSALPPLLPERRVPALVALSWQPFPIGPNRRLQAFCGHDVIQFEFCAHASWMRRIPAGARAVYSAHNVEADYLAAREKRSEAGAGMVRRVEELERLAVESSDLIVACTDADASRFTERYGATSTVVVPNGCDEDLVDLDRAALRESARASLGVGPDELCVLFVGGRGHHNRQAVSYLERELAPRLGTGTTFLIAGQSGGRPGRSSRGGATVLRTGFVRDLRPLLAAADVAVNPVEYGSGSSLKLVEYIAAGMPVVTTPVGLRGFERYRSRVVVAELGDFPGAVLSAAQSPPPADTDLGELRWSAGGKRLYDSYERLLGTGEGTR
jgi:glycosyltransferase involved in cell wall biosynthesis